MTAECVRLHQGLTSSLMTLVWQGFIANTEVRYPIMMRLLQDCNGDHIPGKVQPA